jgi:hypothetical protein
MSPEVVTVVAMVCAGIGVVSTVAYYVFKWKELKTLREIRDKLGQQK